MEAKLTNKKMMMRERRIGTDSILFEAYFSIHCRTTSRGSNHVPSFINSSMNRMNINKKEKNLRWPMSRGSKAAILTPLGLRRLTNVVRTGGGGASRQWGSATLYLGLRRPSHGGRCRAGNGGGDGSRQPRRQWDCNRTWLVVALAPISRFSNCCSAAASLLLRTNLSSSSWL